MKKETENNFKNRRLGSRTADGTFSITIVGIFFYAFYCYRLAVFNGFSLASIGLRGQSHLHQKQPSRLSTQKPTGRTTKNVSFDAWRFLSTRRLNGSYRGISERPRLLRDACTQNGFYRSYNQTSHRRRLRRFWIFVETIRFCQPYVLSE